MNTGLGIINNINCNANFTLKSNLCSKTPLKTYPKNTNALQNQLNFMGINNKISASKDNGTYKHGYSFEKDYSFDNFKNEAYLADIKTLKDLEKEIKPENLLGSGAHCEVYKFSDPGLDNWVLKVYNDPLYFRDLEDNFDGVNMGQEIAYTQRTYSILKKIEGKPHSIENWSKRAATEDFSVTKNEATEFFQSIKDIVAFPQSTFDDYAKQLKVLSDKGYKMDSINPNNLLIDYDNKKISIIDFFKSRNEDIENSRLDLINPILDFSFFKGYNRAADNTEQQNDFFNDCKQIIEKCNLAAKKYDIPYGTENYLEYLKWLDDIYEMPDSTSHISRYQYISDILPGLK